MPVYRYRFQAVDVATLARSVPGPLALVDVGPSVFVDLDAPAPSKDDLDEAMSALGYAYVSTAPTESPALEAASSFAHRSGGVSGLRLSLASATPVTTSDVIGAGTVYLTPHHSGRIWTYDGALLGWKEHVTDEVSIALGGLGAGLYDVFAYWTGAAVALELSAIWTNSTTRADAIARQNGTWVKQANPTRLYLGTFCATGAATTEDSESNRYLWNLYNPVPRPMRRIETANQWGYSVGAWRSANANAANKVGYVAGLPEVYVSALATAIASQSAGQGSNACAGIGLDVQNANSGIGMGSNSLTFAMQSQVRYLGAPGLGLHELYWLEYGGADVVFYGDAGLPDAYQAGLSALVHG